MILLIDDEPAIARLYGAFLQRRGFDIRICPDAAEALELLRERRFHLVLSDVEMPGIDGHEFCRRLNRRGPRTYPLLLLSAHDSVDAVGKGLSAGADDFLMKGADIALILERIAFWLTSGFRALPWCARIGAIDALENLAPVMPLLPDVTPAPDRLDRALARLREELIAAPPDFGQRLIERIRILGRASALLLEGACQPADFLRFPDSLVRVLKGLDLAWHEEAGILFAHFDLFSRDRRFIEAGTRPLAAYRIPA
ncbi:MAG: response regulator [Alphaproteobacteria bacterium]|nr:MAG: response regulator [Alphaproteobacteria bacterium]